ncbi:MAG: PHP domain-containing protein [Acidaminococcaceae bacterium]|jgi:PHP family Zn ribbon phosphoesterase|nr:PHP domain-containing protein [Acidaminococcaceae bacterium]
MKTLLADFHIHSLLSPCAEVEMTPHHLMLRAAAAGIGALALTDHNASANLPALIRLQEKYPVKVFPGMEVECKEEAHLVVLFDKMHQMAAWQQQVDKALSGRLNQPEKLGAQFVVDEKDNLVREEPRMLLGPLTLTAAEVVAAVNKLGGLCFAAHVDRPAYSLLMSLGFLPPELGLAAAEISRNSLAELQEQKLKARVGNLPYVTNSDAHWMQAFLDGPKNRITVRELTIKELRLALAGKEGRSWQAGVFIDN